MQKRKFITKKELAKRAAYTIPDKNKRIIVVQLSRKEYPLRVLHEYTEHLQKAFDDTVKLLFIVVDEIVGDKQIYDVSGADDALVMDIAKEYKKCIKLLQQKKE